MTALRSPLQSPTIPATFDPTWEGYGPNLITNPNFTTDLTGWTRVHAGGTSDVVAGRMRVLAGAGNESRIQDPVIPDPGAKYLLNLSHEVVAGACTVNIYNDASYTTLLTQFTTSGYHSYEFTPPNANIRIYVFSPTAGPGEQYVDNFSLREIL